MSKLFYHTLTEMNKLLLNEHADNTAVWNYRQSHTVPRIVVDS